MNLAGTVLGYDPGGNSSHGVAAFTYEQNRLIDKQIVTVTTANDVIDLADGYNDVIAIGIDTLTCWSMLRYTLVMLIVKVQ